MAINPGLKTGEDIAATTGVAPPTRGNWLWTIVKENRQAKVGLAVLLFFVLVAVVAPWRIETFRPPSIFRRPSTFTRSFIKPRTFHGTRFTYCSGWTPTPWT